MSEELIVFLNFNFELKQVHIKSVSGEVMAEVPRHLVNWREYLAALAASGQPDDPGLEPLSEIYLKHQPDEVLFQDIFAFQTELRDSLDILIREKIWPEESWRRLLRETEGVPVTLEAEGAGDLCLEDREFFKFKFVYLPETYRLRLLLLLREMMLDDRIFQLGREADGRFFLHPPGPALPVRGDVSDLSLSEAATVRLPAVLAAEAAEKLPALLQRMVKERLPEALARKLAEEFPKALGLEVAARLPEALNEAVEAALPEALAAKIEAKLPVALAVKVETRLPYALAAMVDKKLPEALAAEVAAQFPAALAREIKAKYPEALAKAVAAQLPEVLAAEVGHRLPAALEPVVEAAFPEALAAKLAAEYPKVLAEKLNEDLPVILETRLAEELPLLLEERVAEKYPETLAKAVADCLPETLAREVAEHLPQALAPQIEAKLPEALARAVAERLPEALAQEMADQLPERLAAEVAARLPATLQAALEAEKPEAMAALENDRSAALVRAVAVALPGALEQAVEEQLPERLAAEVDEHLPKALEQAVAERLPEALAQAVEEKLPEALTLAMEEKLPEVLESARETLTAIGLPVLESARAGEAGPDGESPIAAPAFPAFEETRAGQDEADTPEAEECDLPLTEEAGPGDLEKGFMLEAGADDGPPAVLEAAEADEEEWEDEPLLLTEIVADDIGFEPGGMDSTPGGVKGKGGWTPAMELLEKEEEEDKEEDEAPILNLEPLEAPEPAAIAAKYQDDKAPDQPENLEAPGAFEPPEELELRRPGPGKKTLEHRLATLEHRFRRGPAPDDTEDDKGSTD